MKLNAVCYRCMIDKETEFVSQFTDEDRKSMHMRDVMQSILDHPAESPSPVFIPDILALRKKNFGVEPFDYSATNLKYDRMILNLWDDIVKEVESAPDPLLAALHYSLAANYIDFSTIKVNDDELMDMLRNASRAKVDDAEYTGHMLDDLSKARSVLFICDNCGEVVLDKIFLMQLKKRFPGISLKIMVKSVQASNDATFEDARLIGLDEAGEVIGSGVGIAGTPVPLISEEAKSALYSADVVITKGQANFETLYGTGLNIYYIFLIKCDLFLHLFGLEKFSAVIENEKRLSSLKVNPNKQA
ncbi:MAG: damage-control phosphatase ARMT1 family protein [Oscillospiraceae bacterium]|jgi:uncharacterized protein with ATP-grasp and redox domains